MIMLLTVIAIILGLTLFAVLAAITLRGLFGQDRPTTRKKQTGRRVVDGIDGIATLAEMLSDADFDPPDFS